ncbi:MAG: cadmium-translocating P-type ATPase [Variibacter sp.]|nr:cadmium-translocating P-type ATPase [Variibacter sp.]
MAQRVDLSFFVRPLADDLRQITLAVEGVHCAGCIGRIEAALQHLPSVVEARLNFSNRRLKVVWRGEDTDPAAFVRTLEALGYTAHPFRAQNVEEEESAHAAWLLRCLAVAGFAAMNIMLLSVSVWSGNVSDITPETRDLFHWISALIALPAAAYAGQPFFRSALSALRARRVNMDVPISLGVLLALGMSVVETLNHAEHAYFDSAVMLLFFLLGGRFLDTAMRRRTRAVAGNLAALKGETAERIGPDGQLTTVPAATLAAGDCVLLRPGDRAPADGIVVAGRSEIDESLVTGESAPRPAACGRMVYAGSLNLSGTLTLRVTAAGEHTLIDEIERLLDKAVKAKSRYLRLADRAARAYAPLVHATAALTLVGWLALGASLHDAVLTAVSVLIITCPCALALAIPVVQVVAAGRLFRHGIFLNAGDAIERLAEVDTVVFDKTGTLTLPTPRVANAAEIAPDVLERAARLALSSRHPLAAALARHAGDRRPFEGASERPGEGVCAVIDGVEARLGSPQFCGLAPGEVGTGGGENFSVIAFRHGATQALFQIRQALRADAGSVVARLRALGFRLHVLSGDRTEVVEAAAAALGIAAWRGGMTSADKVTALTALRQEGRKVLMVGDGLNDAPALAAAHASLSPITAADLSQAHADAIFLGERLAPVLEALATARRARALMRQNLWFAAIYNAFAVPVAMMGMLTPLIAALAMSGSSLIVTLNALRLYRGASRAERAAVATVPAAAAGAPA